ncbi:MAG: ORF6N domain-containing protein [Bacilli bacterium]|nr:ORF6N domain-containing protein [Bacilli bacterium]
MIYVIRGEKVMLDFELAKIYGYETKRFNEQVQRNINKFPSRYRFQLTKEEVLLVQRSKNLTSELWATGKGGRGYFPYAFTEQGIYMLMTVLKGDLATKQSIALIDAFKQMKDYILESNNLLTNTNSYIESRFSSIDKRFESIDGKIETIMDSFVSHMSYKHYLILDGKRIEADVAYQEIYSKASKFIMVIDDYVDVKTLQLLKCCKQEVKIIIITDNKAKNGISQSFINDFINDTGYDLVIKSSNDRFHDRYIVIDYNTDKEILYHCGASSKDAGGRITTISRIEEIDLYKPLIDELLGDSK